MSGRWRWAEFEGGRLRFLSGKMAVGGAVPGGVKTSGRWGPETGEAKVEEGWWVRRLGIGEAKG